jgi:hypothetical protein
LARRLAFRCRSEEDDDCYFPREPARLRGQHQPAAPRRGVDDPLSHRGLGHFLRQCQSRSSRSDASVARIDPSGQLDQIRGAGCCGAGSSPRESAVPSPPAPGSAASAAIAPAGAASAQRTAADSAAPAEAALDRRVQQLESGLGELRDQLDREHDALIRAQARLALAEKAPAAVAPPQANSGRGIGSSIAAILALAAAAFGVYAWRRRRALESRLSPVDPKLQNLGPFKAAHRRVRGGGT